jgi:nucleoid-associated protein YejK
VLGNHLRPPTTSVGLPPDDARWEVLLIEARPASRNSIIFSQFRHQFNEFTRRVSDVLDKHKGLVDTGRDSVSTMRRSMNRYSLNGQGVKLFCVRAVAHGRD